MDAWELLVSNSSLGDGHDAWEHLTAQSGGETIVSVGSYEISFIGEVDRLIEYLVPGNFSIGYVTDDPIIITYIGETTSLVDYSKQETIDMEFLCK